MRASRAKNPLSRLLWLAGVVLLLQACAQAPPTAVIAAIDRHDTAALREALAQKPNLDPPCGPNQICKPLALAASHGNLEWVRMLLAAGADPNGRNAYGDTAYMVVGDVAPEGADLTAIRAYLLTHGTDPNQMNLHNASAFMGSSALGDIVALDLCLRHGGRINEQAPKTGFTPLMAAAQFGQSASVRWLMANGADPRLRTPDGRTASDVAAAYGYAELAAVLKPKSEGSAQK